MAEPSEAEVGEARGKRRGVKKTGIERKQEKDKDFVQPGAVTWKMAKETKTQPGTGDDRD